MALWGSQVRSLSAPPTFSVRWTLAVPAETKRGTALFFSFSSQTSDCFRQRLILNADWHDSPANKIALPVNNGTPRETGAATRLTAARILSLEDAPTIRAMALTDIGEVLFPKRVLTSGGTYGAVLPGMDPGRVISKPTPPIKIPPKIHWSSSEEEFAFCR